MIYLFDNRELMMVGCLSQLPAFDHGRGDPEPDTHVFDRHRHKVVICEGLYLLHDRDGWEEVANAFDLRIFMNSNLDECMRRVKIRNQVQYSCETIHDIGYVAL